MHASNSRSSHKWAMSKRIAAGVVAVVGFVSALAWWSGWKNAAHAADSIGRGFRTAFVLEDPNDQLQRVFTASPNLKPTIERLLNDPVCVANLDKFIHKPDLSELEQEVLSLKKKNTELEGRLGPFLSIERQLTEKGELLQKLQSLLSCEPCIENIDSFLEHPDIVGLIAEAARIGSELALEKTRADSLSDRLAPIQYLAESFSKDRVFERQVATLAASHVHRAALGAYLGEPSKEKRWFYYGERAHKANTMRNRRFNVIGFVNADGALVPVESQQWNRPPEAGDVVESRMFQHGYGSHASPLYPDDTHSYALGAYTFTERYHPEEFDQNAIVPGQRFLVVRKWDNDETLVGTDVLLRSY